MHLIIDQITFMAMTSLNIYLCAPIPPLKTLTARMLHDGLGNIVVIIFPDHIHSLELLQLSHKPLMGRGWGPHFRTRPQGGLRVRGADLVVYCQYQMLKWDQGEEEGSEGRPRAYPH